MSTRINDAFMRNERAFRLTFILIATALMLLFGMFDVSFANSGVGDKIAGEALSWIAPSILIVAGAACIPLFMSRKYAELFGIFAIAIVAGGFTFSQSSVRAMISGIWKGLGFV